MIWFICIVKSVDEVEWPNKLLLVLDIQILEIIPVDLTVGWKKPHNWISNESLLAMIHYYWLINQLWFIEMDKEQSNTSENFISVKQLRLRYWDKNVFLRMLRYGQFGIRRLSQSQVLSAKKLQYLIDNQWKGKDPKYSCKISFVPSRKC